MKIQRERDELRRWTSVNGVIELQRERDEALRWTSVNGVIELQRELDEARDAVERLNAAALSRLASLSTALEERDEWKAKFIQQNKDLGCEQMDPNGTIWDYAKKVQTDLSTMTDQRDRLAGALRIIAEGTSCRECGGEDEALRASEALQSLTT